MKSNRNLIKQIFKLIFILILALPIVRSAWAQHAPVLTKDIGFSCDQTADKTAIKCAYRFVKPEIIKKIYASLDSVELPIKDIKTYPFEDSVTAILLLVDTSRSENPEQIEQIRNHVIALAQQALPYHKIGLASFDTTLDILKPLGSDPEEIIQVAENLTETDQPTELYRNLLDALKLMENIQAERKAIYLFSNGKSEDQSVYHSDVVKAAKKENVNIVSIGYRTPGSTDTTQALRSLAVETGGLYVATTENDFELPEPFISDPFAVIDNGGILTIDLSPVLSGEYQGLQIAKLVFETINKRITVKLPLELSSNNQSASAQFKGNSSVEAENGAKKEETAEQTHQDTFDNKVINTPDSVGKTKEEKHPGIPVWPTVLLALFALAGSVWWFSRSRTRTPTPSVVPEDEGKPLAWLVSLNDESIKYPIERTPWQIGRTRQNDLFLEHSSVSRKHAVIKRNRDGSFTITDLDSLNGIYVNNTKSSTSLLRDKDKIDIGDVRLRFVTNISD